MPSLDIPFVGEVVLGLVLVSAAYTMVLAIGAARGRPHLLEAARWGTYATAALVVVAVCLLGYAFQTHDFRIRYVARYSDRSMPWWYLIGSLWGGQDGSILWWSFLLCGYTTAVTAWMKGRFLTLQPYVLATLMGILSFFTVLMLFPANPFATYAAAVPTDGEGLNPLLQNYWMMIHPPSLYMGFVGWSVPFAFVVAALFSGKLDDTWLRAARPWAMIAWMFLSLGLLLGCVWSYEELGWGGYWAWDPVENASFMPWLVGTAYLHSAVVQERYGMLKVWNVFLLMLTFFMTIFGTFLTRAGLIASVHAFAKSDIGNYFLPFLVLLGVFILTMIVYRRHVLQAEHAIDSLLSREFFFLLNNWVLLGMMVFVLGSTTYPLISELFRGEEATVGPAFYNQWMVPLGLVLLFLTGVGPVIAWRKATGRNLARALMVPIGVALTVGALHVALGRSIGFPAAVEGDSPYDTWVGSAMSSLRSVVPVFSSMICTFVVACIVQEFARGTRVRMRKGESPTTALLRLISRARRRYGGYIVHIGIVLMFFGFTGAAYDHQAEAALRPGETMRAGAFQLRYDEPHMAVDPEKRMVFTEMTVLRDGQVVGHVAPAKYIYRQMPEQPTTEVSIRSRIGEDLYVIMASVDPASKRAIFRVIVRPLVVWIWFGGLVLLMGGMISVWPSAKEVLAAEPSRPRGRAGGVPRAVAATLVFLVVLAGSVAIARAQGDSSSLHAGTVVLDDPEEKRLFGQILCQCGECARLPLDSCTCGWAEDKRAELRSRLAAGEAPSSLIAQFEAQYGADAIAVPRDAGAGRALWAVPLAAIAFAGGVVIWIGRRWKRAAAVSPPAAAEAPAPPGEGRDYDAALDAEIRRFEGET